MRKSRLCPLQGTNLPFDLLFGALFNLPDLLKPNNLSTSCLKYVFKSLCLSLADIFFGSFTKKRINSENYKDFPDIFVGKALHPVTGRRVRLSNGIYQNDKTSNEALQNALLCIQGRATSIFLHSQPFCEIHIVRMGEDYGCFWMCLGVYGSCLNAENARECES